MAKTLKDFLEGYLKVKSADEQKFIDKHVTAKNPDRNGNGDDVFKGDTKTLDRRKERKGYNPGEDEKVYEGLSESTYEFDVSGEHGKAGVDKFVKHANSKGIKAKVHTYDGPAGGNPVVHLTHKDPKVLHSYVNTHMYPVHDISKHKINEGLSESKYEFDVSGEHGNAAVDRLVRHANSKGIKAKVHTYDGPGGGNPVIHLSHKDPKVVHSYVKKHIDPDVDLSNHKINEALKGNQHKIDANKNGKVDAHDFKLLRKKKGVKEESEQIDELSHSTLRGYRMKAKSIADHGGEQRTKGRELAGRKSYGGRMAGIEKAKVMAKEEIEPIDELSKQTLRSYAQNAKDQMSRSDTVAGREMGARNAGAKPSSKEKFHNRRADKRHAGLGLAIDKLAREEVELDEVLTAKSPMGTYIKDFKKSDAPQFKGKSQDKRRVMAIAAKLSAERGGKPLRKEERLQNRINDLTETHQRTLMHVFEKLNEDNKSKFLEACDTPEGVEQMLDFAINNRGE